jgi:hypothetical protein
MASSEKEKIVVFIKDSLTFLLFFYLIYFSLPSESLSTLLVLDLTYFILLLMLVFNFENKSLDIHKIKFTFKSDISRYSFITTLMFIIIYIIFGVYKRKSTLDNGIYFIILDFIMISWYFIVFNWRR